MGVPTRHRFRHSVGLHMEKNSTKYALVAQWIEHLVAVQRVAGSIPAKRTTEYRRSSFNG